MAHSSSAAMSQEQFLNWKDSTPRDKCSYLIFGCCESGDFKPDEASGYLKRISLKLHPDKVADVKATEALCLVNRAKNVLFDPIKKAAYYHALGYFEYLQGVVETLHHSCQEYWEITKWMADTLVPSDALATIPEVSSDAKIASSEPLQSSSIPLIDLTADSDDETVSAESTDSINEYEVEGIVGKRVRRGRVEYKVKWLNYNSSENTWEDIQNLGQCKDLIEKYKRKKIRAIKRILLELIAKELIGGC